LFMRSPEKYAGCSDLLTYGDSAAWRSRLG
jgi:hypothetical protein